MRLYHGSIVEVHKPSLRFGRERTDFGRGFYTTTLAEQAERWANIKKDRAKADKAIVSVYEIDDAVLAAPTLKIREFHGVDEAWLDFVVGCRKERAIKHDYDLVFGPVANDRVYAAFALYEQGLLSKQELIGELKTYSLIDQMLFHTDKSLAYLTFIEAKEVF